MIEGKRTYTGLYGRDVKTTIMPIICAINRKGVDIQLARHWDGHIVDTYKMKCRSMKDHRGKKSKAAPINEVLPQIIPDGNHPNQPCSLQVGSKALRLPPILAAAAKVW